MESVHIFMKNHRDNIRQMKENFGMIISLDQQEAIKKLIDDAVSAGAFPCASVLAGTKDTILFEYRTGNKRVYPDAAPLDKDTLFDLASLTKVSATAPLAMVLTDKGILSLGDKVSDYLPQFSADHTKDIRIGHLLTHTAGLASYIPLYKHCKSSEEAFDLISKEGVCHPTGEQVIYSDLGFILAGRILEIAGGDTLDNLCKKYLYEPMGMEQTFLIPSRTIPRPPKKSLPQRNTSTGSFMTKTPDFSEAYPVMPGFFPMPKTFENMPLCCCPKGKSTEREFCPSLPFPP
jgi:CubicO group peptidase (beta-lactamase class C family)